MSRERTSTSTYESHGATVERTGHYGDRNSGSQDYKITGTREQVDAAVQAVKGAYPPAGYGTWFNWPPPPDGPKIYPTEDPVTHLAPREISPGIWEARGYHSNSCD